jgi:hypothetical protein
MLSCVESTIILKRREYHITICSNPRALARKLLVFLLEAHHTTAISCQPMLVCQFWTLQPLRVRAQVQDGATVQPCEAQVAWLLHLLGALSYKEANSSPAGMGEAPQG